MTFSRLMLFVAVFCFLVALLAATGHVHGANVTAWLAGGLAAFAAGHLP